MSIKAMTWAWSQRISPGEKLVLAAIADHADDNGIAWPGLHGVAQKCSLSRRMIQRYVGRLTTKGLLQRKPQYRADGSRTSDIFLLPIGVIIDTTPMTDVSPPLDTSVTPPWTSTSIPLDTSVQTGTVIEPSLEPLKETLSNERVKKEITPSLRSGVVKGVPSQSSVTPPASNPQKSKTPWVPPEFYEPLTALPGYKQADHSKHADLLRLACAEASVSVSEVVASFAADYPALRHSYGWHDPCAALKGKPLAIQISKVLNGQRRSNGRGKQGADEPWRGYEEYAEEIREQQRKAEARARRGDVSSVPPG